MMPYLYLFCAVLSTTVLNIMGSSFSRIHRDVSGVSGFYNLVTVTSAVAAWGILYAADPFWAWGVLPYGLMHGFFYVLATHGIFGALQNGSLALTSFAKQLSLVLVSLWGFLFWNTPLTLYIGLGLVLIIIAVYFCFKPGKGDIKDITRKWVLYVSMLLVGNAGCFIVQKYQQGVFGGRGDSLMMLTSCTLTLAVCLVRYLCGEKPAKGALRKGCAVFPIAAGMSSAMMNLFVMLMLATNLSIGLIYPTIAAGGMILSVLFSVIVFREKAGVLRWIGLAVGTVAIVLLNIG